MKKLFIVLFLSLFALSATAQVSTFSTFTAKGYDKASTAEDTSATISLGGYPYAAIWTTSTGSDSTPLSIKYDALINGVWVNDVTTATTHTLGRPAGHIIATTKAQVTYTLLRSPATTTIDILGGASSIRIRNKHSAFANGSTDSTAATTYTQKIIMRKP